jgi:hypothetical protein
MSARGIRRVSDNATPRDNAVECGCPMCQLRRAQSASQNHTLSDGVYDPNFTSRATDSSPRASLSRVNPNMYAEINRRNAEFWEKRGKEPNENA